jgi:chorismate dehydratase
MITTDNTKNCVIRLYEPYDAYMTLMEQQKLRLGVVNFLNSTPLIDGITVCDGVELIPKVPSELVGCLEQNEVDIALASSIDYQLCNKQLSILPVGVLSSNGETLTVRLCSRNPLDEISEVYCDTDSHTSIVLLQIVMKNKFGIAPKIIPCNIRELIESNVELPSTILMIGDKVITSESEEIFSYQLDLGSAWHEQTDLPFVFATWFCSEDIDDSVVQRAIMVLDRQLRFNTNRIEQVVSKYSPQRGWDVNVAFRYLTEHIQFSFSEEHRKSLELFYNLAAKIGAIETLKPLRFYGK